MEVHGEIESDRRRIEIQAQQTSYERQHFDELMRWMDVERQSAMASARKAADKEKKEILRAR